MMSAQREEYAKAPSPLSFPVGKSYGIQVWDFVVELKDLIKECGECANKHGWKVTWESYPEYILAAIDELMDSFERGWRNNNKEKAYDEIGDCFVRLFHYCHDLDIPLEDILKRLIKNNKKRSYKHGHKRI